MTPLALVVFTATAVLDKLAIESGWNRTAVHLAANAIIVIVTIFLMRAYAGSLRRRFEQAERAPIQQPEAAGD